MFKTLLDIDTLNLYRLIIGISAMVILFVSFLISFVTSSQKKLKFHKELSAANEREQKILTDQNLVLEEKVDERTEELLKQKEALQQTLNDLQSTQLQLVQREKMASLGELTAGIAHEIQNPLNFVNNFSDLNAELLQEIKEQLKKEQLSVEGKEMLDTVIKNVVDNLAKIAAHGKRADGIVKGMLMHSRNNAGEKEPIDINKLVTDFTRLATHGVRAQDKSLQLNIVTNLAGDLLPMAVVAEDIGRVLINMINNANYSVAQKRKLLGHSYQPMISITTKMEGKRLAISVRDNGIGVPGAVVNKIFQPFFTTKPSGQGTGLGLSLSYDIIKAHQGELKVDSKEGEYAEFTILL